MTLRQLLCLRVASSLPEREFRVSPRFNPGQPGRVNLFANSGNPTTSPHSPGWGRAEEGAGVPQDRTG